ncbi:MAG: RNA polymerase sigma factor [Lachnospiraceae bacterium]|nr:RNA polymerase sigma factor [Lachnospiraceae bacterium]
MTDFQEVYNLYFREVYRYALSLCRNESIAEEITQETFYKALAKLDSFDGKCKVSVWLCQIAKNTYISMCRKDKHLDPNTNTDLLPGDGSIEESFFDRETAFAIHKVLHTLEEPYKEVFSLRTFGELSFKQIAELFGKTETWARVTYHRARLKIKEELK